MADLALIWNPARLSADVAIVNGDLAADPGLETAVILSLFTDAPARADDPIPDGSNDRGGWWGDCLAEKQSDHLGSRLWLLKRTKITHETPARAKEYALEALAWMLEDEVASSIEVGVRRLDTLADGLGLTVWITRPGGPARQQFDYVWSAY